MSLLMDALKRAETSKREAARAAAGHEVPTQPATGTLSLEPLAPGGGDTRPLPDLAAHIDALDADLAAAAPPPAPPRTTPPPSPPPQPGFSIPPAAAPQPAAEAINQAAARNAFAAKRQDAPPSRRPMWIALGTLGVVLAGIGAYVWYQMQAMSGSSLAPTARSAAPLAQRPSPPPAPPALPLAPPVAPANLPPLEPLTAAAPPEAPRSARMPRPETARSPGADEAPGSRAPIRFARTRPEPDTNVQAGYARLQGNQLDAARHDYEQALRNDPNNVDALLALAAIAQRQGRGGDADRYRQRALEADPSNPAAQAAALGSGASGDPQGSESRLKTLLAAQPESGPLNFALGNLYARQGRWPEAQQVYFNAVAADADNPDYLFNLAVSLDHLRQPKLAAQHYRLALEAAERRPAAFDRERARLRLGELQP